MPEVTKSVEVRSKLPSPPLGERVTAEGGRVRRSPWLFSYQTKTGRAAARSKSSAQFREQEPAGGARRKPVRIQTAAIAFWKT